MGLLDYIRRFSMKKIHFIFIMTVFLISCQTESSSKDSSNSSSVNLFIDTSSAKLQYAYGEKLDLSTIKVIQINSDNSISEIKEYSSIPEEGTILDSIGTHSVQIIYKKQTESFEITVSNDTNINAIGIYETNSDIQNLLSYNSISKTFTAVSGYESYRWYINDAIQENTTNTFTIDTNINQTITVIVEYAGNKYSAQYRIEQQI